MADNINALVGDNDAPATWTDVNDITPDQKVLIGTIDERSGNMKAEWRPSSQAAVFKEKTITENAVYDPQQEGADGYSMVTVEVPNTYVAEDEGKVVSGGTLVAQTETSVTTNSVVDTTTISQVTVAVPGVEFAASPAAFTLLYNIRNLNAQIPSGVTSIGRSAFQGCSGLTSIEIPSSVTTIDINAFYGCTGLTSIEIPSSVTSINSNAFQGCSGLTSIEIPSSVTTIAIDAFGGCTNVTSIVVHKAEGSIANAPWGATNATVTWDG